jgi:hypothetical protein
MKQKDKTIKKQWIKPEIQVLEVKFSSGTKSDSYYSQAS